MKTSVVAATLKGHRFAQNIISHTVWLYHRVAFSLRDVEDLLAERGIIASYETIRRNRPTAADKWHLDEVVITIRGKKHCLWRAVNANGDPLEILVQDRRNAKAAKQAQIFLAAHDQISALFRPKRHRLSAISYRHARADAFSL